MTVVTIAALLCVVLVEVFVRIPATVVARRLADVGRRAGGVLSSKRISDHWKERVLLRYSWLMFQSSFELLGFLTLLALIVAATVFAADRAQVDLYAFLLSWQGTAFCIAAATLYARVRSSHA